MFGGNSQRPYQHTSDEYPRRFNGAINQPQQPLVVSTAQSPYYSGSPEPNLFAPFHSAYSTALPMPIGGQNSFPAKPTYLTPIQQQIVPAQRNYSLSSATPLSYTSVSQPPTQPPPPHNITQTFAAQNRSLQTLPQALPQTIPPTPLQPSQSALSTDHVRSSSQLIRELTTFIETASTSNNHRLIQSQELYQRHSMSINTIDKRMGRGLYKDIDEFIADLNSLWRDGKLIAEMLSDNALALLVERLRNYANTHLQNVMQLSQPVPFTSDGANINNSAVAPPYPTSSQARQQGTFVNNSTMSIPFTTSAMSSPPVLQAAFPVAMPLNASESGRKRGRDEYGASVKPIGNNHVRVQALSQAAVPLAPQQPAMSILPPPPAPTISLKPLPTHVVPPPPAPFVPPKKRLPRRLESATFNLYCQLDDERGELQSAPLSVWCGGAHSQGTCSSCFSLNVNDFIALSLPLPSPLSAISPADKIQTTRHHRHNDEQNDKLSSNNNILNDDRHDVDNHVLITNENEHQNAENYTNNVKLIRSSVR